ncbi:MAG TPA: ABC transporter substrate-binding protein [Candidatus Dormibacteraeota bacterium]|nr:ABC transporter substrate-binding protein [Candidatus Dormibacteraeota bacterium]
MKSRLVALVALVLFAAAACAQSQPDQSHELVLGAIYPLSGPQAPGGKQELAGVRAALGVAESSGALKTHVRLHVIDATTPQEASAAVDALVHDYHVPAILGTYGSTLSAAAAARAEALKTVYWETGAVADPITAQRRYVFRTVATGSSLGRIAVTFTHDTLLPKLNLSSPKAVVVRVNDIYGRSVGGGEEALAKTMGIQVVDVIEYNPNAYDPDVIAARLAADHADFLWDVSYLDDGVAIWQAVLRNHVSLRAAIGTSSAFCMPAFGQRLGSGSLGVYAADKPDASISAAALSPAGQALLAAARSVYARDNNGDTMGIPAVAGFVGGWTLFHDVVATLSGSITSETIRSGALVVDVAVGDGINGGGVKFGADGSLDEGQNTRAAAVIGQWQAVGVMRVVFPAAYATGTPIATSLNGM